MSSSKSKSLMNSFMRGYRECILSNNIVVYSFSIFLSAFLMFMLQPMVAKMVLPYLGGATSVWTVCMLFFQGVLFLGYLYAHGSVKYLGIKKQSILHLVLLCMSFYWLPISIQEVSFNEGIHASTLILLILSSSILLPFFLLSSNATIMQKWFSYSNHKSSGNPYVLYAVSNLGSFIALLGYPFIFEPSLNLTEQTFYWATTYIVFAIFVFLSCIILINNYKNMVQKEKVDKASIPWKRKAYWCWLSFVPSSLLVGTTTFITTDIASVPLFWILPLATYLITFVIAFSYRLKISLKFLSFTSVVCVSFIFLNAYFMGYTFLLICVPIVLLFSISYIFHRKLADDSPNSTHLTEYYLWLAFGGMLGGLFNSIIAPYLFVEITEYKVIVYASLLGCVSYAVNKVTGRNNFINILLLFVIGFISYEANKHNFISEDLYTLFRVIFVFICFLVLTQEQNTKKVFVCILCFITILDDRAMDLNDEYKVRSFYGSYNVKTKDRGGEQIRVFSHGTTLHGGQYLKESIKYEPTLYYSKRSGLGLAINSFSDTFFKGKDVAVIGLGVGATSCLFSKDQKITYYEIDQAVADIATNDSLFSFIKGCTPNHSIIIGDARIMLNKAVGSQYKMLVLDAFSSDSIPVHLLTKEAIELYMQKLDTDGVLMVHISNRHLDLKPVLANISNELNLDGYYFKLDVKPKPDNAADIDSLWVALIKSESQKIHFQEWVDLDKFKNNRPVWSDEYSSILHVLK